MANQNLNVKITGDASGLSNAISTASGKLKSFGTKLQGLGRSLSAISLPMALAGGAGVKMALDFDKSMTKIKSLVGVAGAEVDKMGETVKKLAVDTGVSSAEAAEALFFITSAGLEGETAIKALEMSLKGAATGLGNTATIADLATSAMNAYGKDTFSATMATDVLTAAVREGKLEASELAGSMGGVIPIASNMGVEFHEVGAALAAMSRTGTSAANGATQLNAILMGIQKPSEDAKKKLGQLGITFDDLEKSVAEDGLMATLAQLRGSLEGTGIKMKDLFPNIRALKGVMDLTGAGMQDNIEIFNELSNSANSTANAFAITEESAGFKFQKATNQTKQSLQELGEILLVAVVPIVQAFGNVAQKVTGFLKNLPGPLQKLVAGLMIFVAVLGPALIVVGSLISAFGTVMSILPALKAGIMGIGVAVKAALGPIGLIITALGLIATVIYTNWDRIKPIFIKLYNQFVDLYNGSEGLRIAVFALRLAFYTAFRLIKAQIELVIAPFMTLWNLIKEAGKGFKADFGSVLSEGFDNGKKIIANATTDIANFAADGLDNLGTKLEHKVIEEVNEGLENAAANISGKTIDVPVNFNTSSQGGSLGGGNQRENQSSVSSLGDSGQGIVPIDIDTKTPLAAISNFATVYSEKQMELMGKAQEFNAGLSEIVTGGLNNMAVGIGEALGSAIGGAGNLSKNLSQVLLGSLGQMATQMGKLAIHIGLGVQGIKKALESLNPAVAIAAGIALVALGKFATSQSSKIANQKPTEFAKGGIVSAPTLGLMGEYPGAKSNPEVIAPLDKLKSMIGNRGAQQVQVGGSFEIKGQDLVVALERANSTRNRLI
jgi:TP901 family phage tail tape measure protein